MQIEFSCYTCGVKRIDVHSIHSQSDHNWIHIQWALSVKRVPQYTIINANCNKQI